MPPSTALDWQKHITDGRKYLQTAVNSPARPTVFNNELIYQLTAMAIENLLVGVWQYHRQMPCDHTLDGLVDGLVQFCHMEKDLSAGIKAIGRFDDMCPLVPVRKSVPDDKQIRTMLAIGQQVAEFAGQQVLPPSREQVRSNHVTH